VRSTPIRVIKVGGSLFDLCDLPKRLHTWLGQQSAAHNVLLAGGGALVDQVRRWHAGGLIDEQAAHWMCVDLMSVTARLLHGWLPTSTLVADDRQLCRRVGPVGDTVFEPAAWMRQAEPNLPGVRLPATWETTSDAIAGRLAVTLGADELVLLKSTSPDRDHGDLRDLSSMGIVDKTLHLLSASLPVVRLVNVREQPPTECLIDSHLPPSRT